jgi:hypothetical protein
LSVAFEVGGGEMLVEEGGVVEEDVAIDGIVDGLRDAEEGGLVGGEAGAEEVGGGEGVGGEHVIVKVDKMFGEAGNAVKVELNGVGGKGGEIVGGDEILVVDEGEFVVGREALEPGRALVGSDKENAVDPGHVSVDAAEEVFESVPVAEELFVGVNFFVGSFGGWEVFATDSLPVRIIRGNPEDDDVNFHDYIISFDGKIGA